MLKQNEMKSTVKVDLQSQNSGSTPVIKIIQPIGGLDENSPDFDVRDKLIRDFLHTPCMSERNDWFRLATYFPHPMGNEARVHITTIAPCREQELFDSFRNAILNRIIPFDTLIKINQRKASDPDMCRTPDNMEVEAIKINQFFDWLSTQPYADDTDKTV